MTVASVYPTLSSAFVRLRPPEPTVAAAEAATTYQNQTQFRMKVAGSRMQYFHHDRCRGADYRESAGRGARQHRGIPHLHKFNRSHSCSGGSCGRPYRTEFIRFATYWLKEFD